AVSGLPLEQRAEMIRKNPDYGRIVCRCEHVSKGEILDALRSPLPIYSLDAVKRRCRPGMGRCQGGFCSPVVASMIAEEAGIPLEAVTKAGRSSPLLGPKNKEGMDFPDTSAVQEENHD
ncbi:MAG: (2Fe-2S)-binding protein, partial [Sphaerochaetaceae bacterium]|nr:(2Fe-2S)-binding protein [Sphaerochaetaceae bacterium]